jgi:hypothetical protein
MGALYWLDHSPIVGRVDKHPHPGSVPCGKTPCGAPQKSGLEMNLARAFCEAGQFGQARTLCFAHAEFNPDYGADKKLRNMDHEPAPTPAAG